MSIVLGSLQGNLKYGERAPIFTYGRALHPATGTLQSGAIEDLKKVGDLQGVIVEECVVGDTNLYVFDMDEQNVSRQLRICTMVSKSLRCYVQPRSLTLLALPQQKHFIGETFSIGYLSLLKQLEDKDKYSLLGDYALGYKQGPRY